MHSAQNKYTTHYITLQNDTIQYDTMCNIKYSSIQLVIYLMIRLPTQCSLNTKKEQKLKKYIKHRQT